MNVFDITELRKEIFSYLRTSAYIVCDLCKDVCQWDECGPERLRNIRCYGKARCDECFQFVKRCSEMYDELDAYEY